MVSQFFFSLSTIPTQTEARAGSVKYVTGKDVPGFVNISFAHLQLNPKGILEPIWHPNAQKIGYCTQGKNLVSIRTPENREVFTVEKGEMFFIPQGYVHHIENIGQENSIIEFALNHTNPESMSFSKAIDSISDSVMHSTFQVSAEFVRGLNADKKRSALQTLSHSKTPGTIESKYKLNIEKSNKSIVTKGGYLQAGVKKNLAILNGLGILAFGLNPKGAVEPHWHTNAGELVYIVKGHTRITILSPNGNVEELEVKGGEGAFAPASHFHNIENIGSDEVEVIAFFNDADPDYIGIGEVFGSYSNDLLASIFGVEPSYFDGVEKPQGPLVIVPI